MPWYWILLVIAGVLVFGTLFAAYAIVLAAAKPFRFTAAGARKYETGYDAVDFTDFDTTWDRHAFALHSNGVRLRGEYVVHPAQAAGPKKVAIFCHGQTMNYIASVKYAQIFYRLGFNLVLFDARYFGTSKARYSTLGLLEREDLLKVIAYAKTVFGADAYVGLHGESMGAGTALLVADRAPDLRFIVADCPFSDLAELIRRMIRTKTLLPASPLFKLSNALAILLYRFDFRAVRPVDSVRAANLPMLFIHGAGDRFIPAAMSEEMFALCRNKDSELHLVDGAIHAASYRTDVVAYGRIVTDFVQKIANKKV